MDDRRPALADVATAMRPLHRSLIEVTRVRWEKEHAPVPGPNALFALLIHEPFFAWLRPMSGLMAQIDEVLDEEEPLTGERARELRGRVEALVSEGGEDFSKRYLEILQEDPDVVMAHAALRRALDKL